MIKGICKKCGKTLQIEEGLTDFSCMYCGSRLRLSDLLKTDGECDPKEADRLFKYAQDNIVSCVTAHRGILAQFNRTTYTSSFSEYAKACYKTLDSFNSAVILDISRRDIFIDSLIDTLISGLEADWETQPDWSKKKAQNEIIQRDKMIIAVYLVPMVGRLKLSVSDDFCNRLQAAWVEKYPKHKFYVGSYDKITGAYEAKLKLCYITTAVCHAENKPDDCYELETLRNFRDNWLSKAPGGAELISRYYDIAPAIVCCMDLTGGDYNELNEKYIKPCIADIEQGDMLSCRNRYTDMVRNLEKQFLS